MRVNGIGAPSRNTSRAARSMRSGPNVSGAGLSEAAGAAGTARGRRSIARIRATSSPELNGLVT